MTTLQFGHTVIPPQVRIVQIDIEPSEIGKNYPVVVGIIGDARVVMGQLLEEVTRLEGEEDRAELGSMRQSRRQQVRSLKEAWKAWVAKSTAQATLPLQRGFVLHELRACLPREAVVTVDGGANYGWVNFAFEATSPMYFTGDYAAAQEPQIRTLDPFRFVDNSLAEELETEGFLRGLGADRP